jgi:uncharacterized protein YoxC
MMVVIVCLLLIAVAVALFAVMMWHTLPEDFQEVQRRERAMKALKKNYDPIKDTVLDSKARRSGWWE